MASDSAGTDWPISRLLSWTEQYLRQKGIESPRLDAQILLAHVLNVPKIQLQVRFEELVSEEHRAAFKALIKRRVEGCPVAYLVGYREFFLLRFEVTPAVLIPQPDTETLISEALTVLKGQAQPRVLDLGTGSGCIAVTIAHQHHSAEVTATDISAQALEIAQRNADRHAPDRIRFAEGDLFAAVTAGERFDLILSNPPYIAEGEFPDLPVEVREHEPRLALDGGPDGLAVVRELVHQAPAWLNPSGRLMIEIGYRQEEAVRGLFEAAGFANVATLRDRGGHPRVIRGQIEE